MDVRNLRMVPPVGPLHVQVVPHPTCAVVPPPQKLKSPRRGSSGSDGSPECAVMDEIDDKVDKNHKDIDDDIAIG